MLTKEASRKRRIGYEKDLVIQEDGHVKGGNMTGEKAAIFRGEAVTRYAVKRILERGENSNVRTRDVKESHTAENLEEMTSQVWA